MTSVDDRALEHVLDGTPPDPDDAELAEAIARVERDLDRIRRGLLLVAADEPATRPRHDRPWGRALAAAAAVAAVAAAIVVAAVLTRDDDEQAQVAAPSGSTQPLPEPQSAPTPETAATAV